MKVVLRQPDQPRDYRIITVIELKRDDESTAKAESQMTDYMIRINQLSAPPDSFKGFLVSQDTVRVFSYSGLGVDRTPAQVDMYSMFDPANPWTRDLADIAIQYWN